MALFGHRSYKRGILPATEPATEHSQQAPFSDVFGEFVQGIVLYCKIPVHWSSPSVQSNGPVHQSRVQVLHLPERKHNIVDSLLFANLCLINGISLYYYGRTEVLGSLSHEMTVNLLAIVQAVLIILPLLLGTVLLVVDWIMSMKKRNDYEKLPSLEIDRDHQQ